MATLKSKFEAAAEAVQALHERPDNDTLLKLYAFYKQGTKGDVSGSRPGLLDFVGRSKYDAWAAIKGTSKDKAMQAYVDLVDKLRAADR
jgi:diazepam-binding inhibitor (GABA receptor modulating acyl-CoA-binding protein)